MSDPTPKRRWSFSLRTMFVVVTIVGPLSGWITYQLNWIRQRNGGQIDGSLWKLPDPSSNAPWPLWLFGDFGRDGISQTAEESESRQDMDAERERLRRLFPEAIVTVQKDSEWMAEEKRRLESQFPGATVTIERPGR